METMASRLVKWVTALCISVIVLWSATAVPANAWGCMGCPTSCANFYCAGQCNSGECSLNGATICFDCTSLEAFVFNCIKHDGDQCQYICGYGIDYECFYY